MTNNIFNNPIGWAENMFGTKPRYITYIFLTVLIGVLAIFPSIVLPESGYKDVVSFVLIFVGAIVLPLCYLRALREMIVERKKRSRY